MRGGKAIPLKPAIDEAFSLGGCEGVRKVIVYQRTGGKINWVEGRDVWMHEVSAGQSTTCDPVWVDAELLDRCGCFGRRALPASRQRNHCGGGDVLRVNREELTERLARVAQAEPVGAEHQIRHINPWGEKVRERRHPVTGGDDWRATLAELILHPRRSRRTLWVATIPAFNDERLTTEL